MPEEEEEGIEVGDSLESSEVDLRKLDGSNLRLDAIHYAPSYLRAVEKVKQSGFPTEPLASFAAKPPFTCGRFKRIYVRDPARGHAYLAPYELMNFKPFRERYLSKKLTEDAEKFYVKDGWLLITASGTVGVPVIATKEKEGYFLSHDLIRIIPSRTPRRATSTLGWPPRPPSRSSCGRNTAASSSTSKPTKSMACPSPCRPSATWT